MYKGAICVQQSLEKPLLVLQQLLGLQSCALCVQETSFIVIRLQALFFRQDAAPWTDFFMIAGRRQLLLMSRDIVLLQARLVQVPPALPVSNCNRDCAVYTVQPIQPLTTAFIAVCIYIPDSGSGRSFRHHVSPARNRYQQNLCTLDFAFQPSHFLYCE